MHSAKFLQIILQNYRNLENIKKGATKWRLVKEKGEKNYQINKKKAPILELFLLIAFEKVSLRLKGDIL